jgi:hypothetical protein
MGNSFLIVEIWTIFQTKRRPIKRELTPKKSFVKITYSDK